MKTSAPTSYAVASMLCTLVGLTLSGCGETEAPTPAPTPAPAPTPTPAPTVAEAWALHRAAWEGKNLNILNGYVKDSGAHLYVKESGDGLQSNIWSSNQQAGGSVESVYVPLLKTLPDGEPTLINFTVSETGERSVFFTWTGGDKVDFVSELLIFNERTEIIYHFAYIRLPAGEEDRSLQRTLESASESYPQVTKKWKQQDFDGLMAYYKEDSRVFFADKDSIQTYTGPTAIRGFFASSPNNTLPITGSSAEFLRRSSDDTGSLVEESSLDSNETMGFRGRIITMYIAQDNATISSQFVVDARGQPADSSRTILA